VSSLITKSNVVQKTICRGCGKLMLAHEPMYTINFKAISFGNSSVHICPTCRSKLR
jgi:hypothetical protein